MSIERIIGATKLLAAMEDFSAEVDEGNYGRLPYSFWKSLKKMTSESTTIFLEINYHWETVTIGNINSGVTLSIVDDSFGTFITQTYPVYSIEKITLECDDDPMGFAKFGSLAAEVPSDLREKIKATFENDTDINRKDNNNMNTFNFDFGPVTNNQVHLSPYGMAIKNSQGTWVAYNGTDVVDVDIFNFDAKKFLYKLPVAIKDIAVGDVVIHNRLPMFVVDVKEGIKVIDVYSGEKKEILLTKNMFGFDFATKVVSILDFSKSATAASADNPFGSMLPFFLLNNEKDMDSMTLLLLTANNGVMGNSAMDFSNPFMIMALMGDKNNKNDMLLPLLLMNQQKPAPTLPPISNP